MAPAANILDELGISHKTEVVSAHRMPEDMVSYAKQAASNGLRVIIAGAGGAAHLPGMVASITTLPVVGVPLPFLSYGGTSLVTILLGFGILMSIHNHKTLMSTS
jgi:5-(carboxyamino)imidazole ribonucleotide mutase